MKKLIIIFLVCLIILVSFYFCLKPENKHSLAELQQESAIDSGGKNAEQNFSESIHSDKHTVLVKSLQDFVEKAPFKQQDTYSILARNPEYIQKYLSDFSKFIDEKIIKNSNLSENEKAKILWTTFKEFHWIGEDNAFKAIIKDKLMYLKNPFLIPEITTTYSDISTLGEKSVNARHDLLEIINSVDIEPKHTNNKLVIETLRSDLRSINGRSEAQNLSDMAITMLYDYGKLEGIDTISDVIQAANNNTQASLSYMNSILKQTLVDTDTNQLKSLVQSNMTQSTRDDFNHAILFNLKEGGNIPVSTIDKESLVILERYLNMELSSRIESKKNIDLQQVYGEIASVLKSDK